MHRDADYIQPTVASLCSLCNTNFPIISCRQLKLKGTGQVLESNLTFFMLKLRELVSWELLNPVSAARETSERVSSSIKPPPCPSHSNNTAVALGGAWVGPSWVDKEEAGLSRTPVISLVSYSLSCRYQPQAGVTQDHLYPWVSIAWPNLIAAR